MLTMIGGSEPTIEDSALHLELATLVDGIKKMINKHATVMNKTLQSIEWQFSTFRACLGARELKGVEGG